MNRMRVFVTGGGRGIGRAIALRFARAGAHVAVAARTATEIEGVAAEIGAAGGRGFARVLDVGDLSSVASGVPRILEFLEGKLDVLVNNAGVFDIRTFGEMDVETWRRHIAVNLDGPFHVTLASLAALCASGRAHVFNIASVAARQPYPGNTAYCASKYGLRGFGDALRLDLAEQRVRVSTVYPGATDTAMIASVGADWDRTRMHRPEDVAEVVWRAWNSPPDADVDDLEVPLP